MSANARDFFGLKQHQTTVRRELLAAVTTFMTMAYIVAVNPMILGDPSLPEHARMPIVGVMAATCLASAVACILMGLVSRYPFALAPGMGINAYFAYVVAVKYGYRVALGVVFLAGLVFLILTFVRVRQLIIDSVPTSLKHSVAAGIGLFIAFIGFQNAGLVVASNTPTMVTSFGQLTAPILTAVFGLGLIVVLYSLRVRGAILIGIVAATVFYYFADAISQEITKQIELPASQTGSVDQGPAAIAVRAKIEAVAIGCGRGIADVFRNVAGVKVSNLVATPVFSGMGALDVRGALNIGLLEVLFAFLFVGMFDAVGTVVGLADRAGYLREGKLPRATQVLACDATGTLVGSLLGTSTVTAYIESAAGIEEGGRTGLTAIFVGLFFLAAMFLSPIVGIIPKQATAPALIVVGAMMISCIKDIAWDDPTEGIPAFFVMASMPFFYSIAQGIALGFIFYPVAKVAAGRWREVHWLVYLLGLLFALRFVLLGHIA